MLISFQKGGRTKNRTVGFGRKDLVGTGRGGIGPLSEKSVIGRDLNGNGVQTGKVIKKAIHIWKKKTLEKGMEVVMNRRGSKGKK